MTFINYPDPEQTNGAGEQPPMDDNYEHSDGDSPNAPPEENKPFSRIQTLEIFQPLPPIKWLIQALDICPGPPTLTAGYGFSAKTVSWQAAAIAIASGGDVWGTFRARKGRVLHIDYEQGRRLTLERYQRLLAAEMLAPQDLEGGLEVVTMPEVYLDSKEAEEVYTRECAGFDLVIVDSLRAAAPSIEENSSDVRRVLDMLTRVSESVGCTFVVVHHARKPQAEKTGGAKMAIRGSGAIYDACASVLCFDGEKDKPTKVSHEKARVTGLCAKDFTLTVSDVEIDGNPRAGLRVLAEALPDRKAADSGAFDALMDRIVESLRTDGPAASKTTLAVRVQGKREHKFGAIDQLVLDGRIVVSGKVHALPEGV